MDPELRDPEREPATDPATDPPRRQRVGAEEYAHLLRRFPRALIEQHYEVAAPESFAQRALRAIGGANRTVMKGALAGGADEAEAVLRLGFDPVGAARAGGFRALRAEAERKQQDFAAAHPKTATALEVGGAFATPTIAGKVAQGAKLGARMTGYVKGGAATGGVAGALSDDEHRGRGALVGTGVGAVGGGVLGPAVEAVTGGAQWLGRSAVRSRPVQALAARMAGEPPGAGPSTPPAPGAPLARPRTAALADSTLVRGAQAGVETTGAPEGRTEGRSEGLTGTVRQLVQRAGRAMQETGAEAAERLTPEGRAMAYLTRQFGRDNVTPDMLEAVLEGAAPDDPRFLLNHGGANVRLGAKVTQAIPSRATEEVPRRLTTQMEGALDRLEGRLADATGGPLGQHHQRTEALQQEASAAARPYYEAVQELPVPQTEELDALFERPGIREALTEAARNSANAGRAPAEHPTVGQLDAAKKVLDAQIESLRDLIQAGNARSAEKEKIHGLIAARDALVAYVDHAAPAGRLAGAGGEEVTYAQARAVAQAGLQRRDAFTAGYQAPRKRLPDVQADEARAPAPAHYAEGYATRMRDQMQEARERKDGWRDVTARLFDSDAARQKLETVLPDPRLREQFALERTLRAHAEQAMLPHGSQTTPVAAALLDAAGGDVAGTLARLGAAASAPARSAALWVAEKGARRLGLNEQAAGLAGDLLTSRVSPDDPRFRALVTLYRRQQREQAARAAAGRAGARGGTSVGVQRLPQTTPGAR